MAAESKMNLNRNVKTKLPKYIMSQAIVSTRTRINKDINSKCYVTTHKRRISDCKSDEK